MSQYHIKLMHICFHLKFNQIQIQIESHNDLILILMKSFCMHKMLIKLLLHLMFECIRRECILISWISVWIHSLKCIWNVRNALYLCPWNATPLRKWKFVNKNIVNNKMFKQVLHFLWAQKTFSFSTHSHSVWLKSLCTATISMCMLLGVDTHTHTRSLFNDWKRAILIIKMKFMFTWNDYLLNKI